MGIGGIGDMEISVLSGPGFRAFWKAKASSKIGLGVVAHW